MINQQPLECILVLGNKPGSGCRMGAAFQENCLQAIGRVQETASSYAIIVSGGRTVAHCPSEAELGIQYLQILWTHLLKKGPCASKVVFYEEDQARTTPENITYTLTFLKALKDKGNHYSRLCIIGRPLQIFRARIILWWLCKRQRDAGVVEVVWEYGPDDNDPLSKFAESIVCVFTLVDPFGWHLWPLKKLMRNG